MLSHKAGLTSVVDGFHTLLKRFSLEGGACILDDSISTCCVIHKKVSGEQPCEHTVYTCKPVNCVSY